MSVKETTTIRRGVSREADPRAAAEELYESLKGEGTELVFFFVAPQYDLEELGGHLARLFGETKVIGCTTAGEITPIGYVRDSITGVALPSSRFRAVSTCIENVSELECARGAEIAEELRSRMRKEHPELEHFFAFLLIDGLTMSEEKVVSSLHQSLSDVPLFGGSAGDGVTFKRTFVYADGKFRTDAAALTLVGTKDPFHVFKTEHFESSEEKVVVTRADPDRRIVHEINGLPAGEEYARLVGLGSVELSPMIFATYPVVVRVGGKNYVRSIQQVNEDGSLTFFCAIDEGIVLTLARGVDLLDNLRETLENVKRIVGPPQLVLACDCILRNLEVDQKELVNEVSDLLDEYNAVGFGTYGEQFNGMHVNQTFTGVAIGAETED